MKAALAGAGGGGRGGCRLSVLGVVSGIGYRVLRYRRSAPSRGEGQRLPAAGRREQRSAACLDTVSSAKRQQRTPSPDGRGSLRSAHRRERVVAAQSAERRGEGVKAFRGSPPNCCGGCLVPENPSPRLFRAECFGADSLHAGLRAPEPTLSRGERVAPVRFTRWVLASRPPTLPIFRAEGGSTVNSAGIIHASVHPPTHRDPSAAAKRGVKGLPWRHPNCCPP